LEVVGGEGRGGDLHVAVGVVLGDDFVDVPFRDVDDWGIVSPDVAATLLFTGDYRSAD
jgi:hypothetical protein